MADRIRCFLIETTESERRSLRRYSSGAKCTGPKSYHDEMVWLTDAPRLKGSANDDQWPHDDYRWPRQCACGYVFLDTDFWQLFTETIYRRADTGELTTIYEAPAGAIWNAHWWPNKNEAAESFDG